MKNSAQLTLTGCFEHYENLQIQHLDAMKTQTLPDLERMTRERNDSFNQLKASLETLMADPDSNPAADRIKKLSSYETRLSMIMDLDQQIGIEIQRHKNKLQERLKYMKKGKQAIKGYHPHPQTNSQNPCVLSMNR